VTRDSTFCRFRQFAKENSFSFFRAVWTAIVTRPWHQLL